MKKSIKFKERVLLYLDLSITLGMILLDLLILMFILAFFDIAINSEDEIGLTITTVIIFITPLIIAFYLISKTLFTILFQKGDMPDIFIVNKRIFLIFMKLLMI